jgi:peptidyl-prolyl cis-trans isomerase D
MLQTIREKAQGWIAWVIVILITIPFALWGIGEYTGIGGEPVVATVNGQEITERDFESRYQQFRNDLRQRLGSAYRPELFQEELMRQQVLDRMIDDLVIEQASRSMGLYAGDELVRQTILQFSAFQKDNQFDRQAYERALRLQGYGSPAQFEERVRQSLITSQLGSAVRSTEFATPAELENLVRLQEQQREFSYLEVPLAEFRSDEALEAADLEAYYEDHKARFRTPERVKVDYLLLDLDTLAAGIEPSEEDLLAFYELHREEYGKPEQRVASHILVNLPEDADADAEAEARGRIEAALARIRAGEEFAEVAKEVSEDPGSAAAGGDLGLFGPGAMVPEFEEAAFAAEVGEVTEPVRSPFGLHLILVTEVQPETIKQFDEAREQVLAALRKNEAEQLLYDEAERLADLAYEQPDSLEPAAEELGLELQTSDWFARDGGEGLLAHPKVKAAAFSEEVLTAGNNSEVLDLGDNRMLALRVREHEVAAYKPLDDVRAEVEDLVRDEQALERARDQAEQLVARLESGASLQELQAETGYELNQPGSLGRDSGEAPAGLVHQAFQLPRPGEAGAVYGLADLAGGNFAVVALTEVKDGTLEDLEPVVRETEITTLESSAGQANYQHLVRQLRAIAEIEITPRSSG